MIDVHDLAPAQSTFCFPSRESNLACFGVSGARGKKSDNSPPWVKKPASRRKELFHPRRPSSNYHAGVAAPFPHGPLSLR
ncbi:unnamed protein product [Larinioides sclopetarius]|uniref:Ribosomal protein L2 n=1 Tax=Larinioides sclopetarius TaxID=280406 RepID=A0AAV2AEE1_9ARAC